MPPYNSNGYIKQDHQVIPPISIGTPVYRNSNQYIKLLRIWSYIIDNPDILVDAGYDVDTIPDLFHECRDVLFSSSSSSLLKYQMKELNKIWRILKK